MYSGISNKRTVWNKRTGQDILPKLINAQGCHSTYCSLHLYYKVRCLFVCQHSNVQTLTSPPVLKLLDSQGYVWLPYDLAEVIKLIGETFGPKKYFFSKKYFMSFLPHYCHSFRITVIPSGLLSFLPDYCHSFRISVIPSKYCHSFRIIQRITNTN
jgi:hypothetical protein